LIQDGIAMHQAGTDKQLQLILVNDTTISCRGLPKCVSCLNSTISSKAPVLYCLKQWKIVIQIRHTRTSLI